MTTGAQLGLDDIRALFAASKLSDKLLNEAIITLNEAETEYTASTDYLYASGDVELFEGRGKTPYDALVALSRELRDWMYGKSSAVTQPSDYDSYVLSAMGTPGGSTGGWS